MEDGAKMTEEKSSKKEDETGTCSAKQPIGTPSDDAQDGATDEQSRVKLEAGENDLADEGQLEVKIKIHEDGAPELEVREQSTADQVITSTDDPSNDRSVSPGDIDWTCAPSDPQELAVWVAEKIRTLKSAAEDTAEQQQDEDDVTMAKDQGSDENCDPQKAAEIERQRQENRERKKRWRESNEAKNKDNDLRARLNKRAKQLFEGVDPAIQAEWIEDQFARRRAKREVKSQKGGPMTDGPGFARQFFPAPGDKGAQGELDSAGRNLARALGIGERANPYAASALRTALAAQTIAVMPYADALSRMAADPAILAEINALYCAPDSSSDEDDDEDNDDDDDDDSDDDDPDLAAAIEASLPAPANKTEPTKETTGPAAQPTGDTTDAAIGPAGTDQANKTPATKEMKGRRPLDAKDAAEHAVLAARASALMKDSYERTGLRLSAYDDEFDAMFADDDGQGPDWMPKPSPLTAAQIEAITALATLEASNPRARETIEACTAGFEATLQYALIEFNKAMNAGIVEAQGKTRPPLPVRRRPALVQDPFNIRCYPGTALWRLLALAAEPIQPRARTRPPAEHASASSSARAPTTTAARTTYYTGPAADYAGPAHLYRGPPTDRKIGPLGVEPSWVRYHPSPYMEAQLAEVRKGKEDPNRAPFEPTNLAERPVPDLSQLHIKNIWAPLDQRPSRRRPRLPDWMYHAAEGGIEHDTVALVNKSFPDRAPLSELPLPRVPCEGGPELERALSDLNRLCPAFPPRTPEQIARQQTRDGFKLPAEWGPVPVPPYGPGPREAPPLVLGSEDGSVTSSEGRREEDEAERLYDTYHGVGCPPETADCECPCCTVVDKRLKRLRQRAVAGKAADKGKVAKGKAAVKNAAKDGAQTNGATVGTANGNVQTATKETAAAKNTGAM
ncbi:MAG: hypothetical protein M1826_000081 [Phylliscum demangeonii]|nr:MAG: hypothetical protein M1826_000081 [Phylliscum demangeonii]